MLLTSLTKCSLFKGCDKAEIEAILTEDMYHIHSFYKDEIVFPAMKQADRIGIVLSGRLQVQKIIPNGSQINFSVKKPGDMIGPAAVFSKAGQYPCEIAAAEESTVLFFFKKDILKIMTLNPHIMENFISEIASATYMLQQQLELMSYSGIAQKAAFYLLINMRRTGKDLVPIPESITKWAMILNVSRPSLHRELKNMEVNGLIKLSSHEIKIADAAALQKILELQKAKN